jgi:hypothetical protein
MLLLRAGAHPGGAHEATGNEADAVDVAEHHFHQLRHEFLHHPHLVVVSSFFGNFLPPIADN